LTEYARQRAAIRSAGADVVALSVDAPAESEALRAQLGLEFPVLCDTERTVVRAWDLYNARERGGIAVPAAFVVDPDRRIRYRSIDATATRVRTDGVLEFLRNGTPPNGRTVVLPRFADWFHAIGNALRGNESKSQ
jgi:peroxiredoxin